MAKAKVRADCRADTRGGSWAGIPLCVINSTAYRLLGLYARAILVEITGRMNGYNNGTIAVSQRELSAALGSTNYRAIGKGIAELMAHGLIDVTMEGQWKERQAREYRLTFVTTKHRPATNEYLKWAPTKESGDDTASATHPQSADTPSAAPRKFDTAAAARIADHRRKSAISEKPAADAVSSLISKPYPLPEREGLDGNDSSLPAAAVADDRDADAFEADVRTALNRRRKTGGAASLVTLAKAAGADPGRVLAFVDRADTLPPATLARLSREICRAAA